ncbi:Aspartyl protease [Handroanthus impetiginosus]|uniref:Aspartyl protease n=1 Tax=Handroanthus impetiginosus TaxID=429701 RepID=A0A2G9GQL9_9LAMI|nr:Aspartyl protease [Handroanthus impetiginosus]
MASPFFVLFFITLFSLQISLSQSSLVLPLSHSLSPSHFNSTHNLLKSTAARSASRFRHHRRQVSLPLSPGSDYTISFSLGSQTISLYMDTGSDVVWLPCHPFECILCEGKYSPSSIPNPGPLNLTSAAATSCKSPACSAVHSSLPSSDLCAIAKCPLESIEISDCKSFSCPNFYYAYGDGSLVAKLYEDTFSIPMSTPSLKLPKFTFGCAHSALGEPIGVAGFGRGILSLPAQLARSLPEIGNYFSYCLISHSFDTKRISRPSPLILGRYDKKRTNEFTDSEAVYYSFTPLLENPKHAYFYCVGLEAVSIGRRRIEAPESLRRVDRRGNGGMVVDSGTTFTMLPGRFYDSVVGEFDIRVGSIYKRAKEIESTTGLSPCYYGNEKDKLFKNVPQLLLHFGGNSTVALPRINYFYEFLDGGKRRKVGCLMLMNGGDEAESGGGPAGLLGNYQQQGFEVVYDLEMKRVGFARRKCASLWDSLN